MFNQKKTAAEMKEAGLVGHVFADDEFQQKGLICSHFDSNVLISFVSEFWLNFTAVQGLVPSQQFSVVLYIEFSLTVSVNKKFTEIWLANIA